MDILLVEPYFAGSHAAWARGLSEHSGHRWNRLTLPGQNWKWRMHGGALTLARQLRDRDLRPDLIVATDMLDLTTFLALTRDRTAGIPVVAYFHENQLAYPWSPRDRDARRGRDRHYGFINLATALAADAVWFNSAHNRDTFLAGVRDMLARMRDHQELERVSELAERAEVVPLGLDLRAFDAHRPREPRQGPPLILWSHRWEHDKAPEPFFRALFRLADAGHAFEVAVLGAHSQRYPPIFDEARQRLGNRLERFGYAGDLADYARWLWAADILPVTSHHDFFGISVAEAVYCRTFPLLPDALAYPELLPEPEHRVCFYRAEEDLTERLAALLRDGTALPPKQLADWIARFDWSVMAPVYDRKLETLAGSG